MELQSSLYIQCSFHRVQHVCSGLRQVLRYFETQASCSSKLRREHPLLTLSNIGNPATTLICLHDLEVACSLVGFLSIIKCSIAIMHFMLELTSILPSITQ